MNKITLLILSNILFLGTFVATGQRETRFTQLGIDQGLSNGSVTGIVQDTIGFIYIATKNGLNRYDGTEFKVYNEDSSNLSANDISSLLIDSKHRMWIATIGGGINRYNISKDDFFTYRKSENSQSGLQSNIIHTLFEDSSGNIWAGTENGISLYIEEINAFKTFLNQKTKIVGKGSNSILSLFEQKNNTLWLGTNGDGLYKFDRDEEAFVPYIFGNEKNAEFSASYILDIEEWEDGLLLATNGKGLIKLNLEDNFSSNFFERTNLKNLQVIRYLWRDKLKNLWVGTDGEGLIKVPQEEKAHPEYVQYLHDNRLPNSLANNTISAIFEDKQKNIWIGTAWRGISLIEKKAENIDFFQSDAQGYNSYPVLSMYKENGTLWMGTDGGGLSQYNFYSGTTKSFNKDSQSSTGGNFIQCIRPDGDAGFLLGTFTNGLVFFDPSKGVDKQFTRIAGNTNSLPYDDVRDIVVLPSQDLWVATWGGGFSYFDRETETFKNFRKEPNNSNSVSSDNILSLLKEDKILWVGTYDGGLNKFDTETKTFQHFSYDPQDSTSIASNYIFSTIKDIDGSSLWLGTKNGLSEFDLKTSEFKNISVGNSMNTNSIVGLLQDNSGKLWMATKSGVFSYNPKTEMITPIADTDGEYHINASFKDSEGKIYFGGIHGVISINPKIELPNVEKTKIAFTDFKLFNESVVVSDKGILESNIYEQKEITLSHNQNVFTFNFSSLDFPFSNPLGYAVKMEGFEDEWRNIGKLGTATFTNLSPGEYTFMVKLQGFEDTSGNSSLATMKIEIRPPFWLTWWAYLLYGVLVLLSLWSIRYYTLKWAEVKNNLKTEKLRREQEDELHEVKQRFFTNISHEIRTPLTLIMGTLNSLLKGNFNAREQKQIRTLKSSSNRLLNLVNELLNIRKLETGSIKLQVNENNLMSFVHEIFLAFSQQAINNDVRYLFKKSHTHIPVWFDKIQLEKTVYNLIVNAFKFTKPGDTIKIQVQMDSKHAYIKVKDTGLGIDNNKLPHIFERFYQNEDAITQNLGFGIGLSITKEIVELHKGQIKVKSKAGKGSRFSIILPLDNSHFESSQIDVTADEVEQIDRYSKVTDDQKITDKEFLTSKILVVEDNSHLRNYLMELLSNDFEISAAPNGKIGLQMAIDQVPDCIISDVMMPEMDGITLCYELKTNIMTSHIPIILLTARTMVENIMEGYETGADDYLVKPFNEDILKTRIKNLLSNRKQLRERYTNAALLHPKDVILTSPDQEFLSKLNHIVEKNIDEPEFNVDQLAFDMAMSHSGLYKKLKALTGLTIIGFIKDFRLKRAAQMLEQHKCSITDIGFNVGYTDRKHFSQEFKKKFGLNPSEYGKIHRNASKSSTT